MRRRNRTAGWLAGSAVVLSGWRAGAEEQAVRPAVTDEPVVNPGKGWVLYRPLAEKSEESLSFATSGYGRYDWSEIEPEEGKFDWEPIDDRLEAWAKKGKQFAFGVMAANVHSRNEYVTPKWVFDAGAPMCRCKGFRVASQVNPDSWEDPMFTAKLRNFVLALGKRYDGDARIAFFDIRSYGNWGEGHLYLIGGKRISAEGYRRHIQLHQEAFRKTQLVLPWGEGGHQAVYDWAVNQGIGLRRDGVLGNSNGGELTGCLGKAPSVIEWYGSYAVFAGHAKEGHDHGHSSYVTTDARLGERIVDTFERAKATYMNLGQWGKDSEVFLEYQRPLIRRLTNRLGYHFVLVEARLPKTVLAPAAFETAFTWRNQGVAFIHIPALVAVALLDAAGQPLDTAWVDACVPAKWAPDKPVTERASVSFGAAKPGTYRLAVGLFQDKARERPPIRLGNKGVSAAGWLPLAEVVVE